MLSYTRKFQITSFKIFLLKSSLKLEYLDMTNAVIDLDSINSLLKHCKMLKSLSLESLCISNQTLYFVSENTNLTTLNLCMVEGITADGLILILSSLKK